VSEVEIVIPDRMSVRLSRELRSFVAIGVLCTAAYAVLYSLLRGASLPPAAANALALAATVGLNFTANRRYTFRATREPLGRQLAGYAVAYCLGLAASSVALAAILGVLDHPRGLPDTAAAVSAGLAATLVRYALMRTWVFRASAAESAGAGGPRGTAAGTEPA
jgi:putative flippase GtrA